jgi:glucose dehydrogenase
VPDSIKDKEMGWNTLAAFVILFGFLLMFKALDTLIPGRAWFFLISGLILFLPGATRLYLQTRRRVVGEE